MRTVIVADALMGLDNVLAVAGASHGNLLLVALGLLISVPIVMWGSTIVLRIVERVPAVVYLGAGVLVWTGVVMVRGEPVVKGWLADHAAAMALGYALVPAVLLAAFVHNHRRLDSRIRARLRSWPSSGRAPAPHSTKENPTCSTCWCPSTAATTA